MRKHSDDFQDLFIKSKKIVEDDSAWKELGQKIKDIFSNLPETDYLEDEEDETE